jgi:HSP20 family protein
MDPDDRDDRDPFSDLFDELERVMNEMMGDNMHVNQGGAPGASSDIHLTTYEEDDKLRVVADVPGVDKDAIDLKCDGTVLTIDAASDHRDFQERIQLPATVDEHSASASYNNGVLEITFERADDSADINLR